MSLATFDAWGPMPAIVEAGGTDAFSKIEDGTGQWIDAFGNRVLAVPETRTLDVSSAKNLEWVFRKGILTSNLTYITKGLLAVRCLLSYRNQVTPDLGTWITTPEVLPDGAFPGESLARTTKVYSYHHKSIVMQKVAQSLLQVKQSAFYIGATRTEVDALIIQCNEYAQYCLNFSNHTDDFVSGAAAGNQIVSAIAFFEEMAVLTGNALYSAKARSIYENLETNTDWSANFILNGTGALVQEKEEAFADLIGLDGSYNAFSTNLMTHYYYAITDPVWAAHVLANIRLMVLRQKEMVDLAGVISTLGWTRTTEEPPRSPLDVDFNYCSFIVNTSFGDHAGGNIATDFFYLVWGIGQAFTHKSKLEDGGIIVVNAADLIYDWSSFLSLSRRLTTKFGRTVTFEKLSSGPIDKTQPRWKGAGAPIIETAVVSKAVFLPASGPDMGELITNIDLLAKIDRVALVPPPTTGEQLQTFNTIVDYEQNRNKIEWVQVLKPGAVILLYLFGVCR